MRRKLELWLLGEAEVMVIALKRSRWINHKCATRLLGMIDARLVGRPENKSQPRRLQ